MPTILLRIAKRRAAWETETDLQTRIVTVVQVDKVIYMCGRCADELRAYLSGGTHF
jgi:hypothetical protein